MGYRSDVRIIVSKKGYEQLKKFTDSFLKQKQEDCNLLDNPEVFHNGKNGVLLGWNNIKWYEYCDDNLVNSILKGLENLKNKDMSYRIARLGENYDDYDESYYDSGKEEQDIAFPSIIRKFDDEDIKKELDYTYDKEIGSS